MVLPSRARATSKDAGLPQRLSDDGEHRDGFGRQEITAVRTSSRDQMETKGARWAAGHQLRFTLGRAVNFFCR